MNDKIKNMIDQASSDGIITSEELKFIKNIAKKEKVNLDEVDFYILQKDVVVEDNCDYEISNEELNRRLLFWIENLNKGSFEGIVEPFPPKKNDDSSKKLLNTGAKLFNKASKIVKDEEKKMGMIKKFAVKAVMKTADKSTNLIPGGKTIKNMGGQLLKGFAPQPKKYNKEDIIYELNRYLNIVKFRVGVNKFDNEQFTLISNKIDSLIE